MKTGDRVVRDVTVFGTWTRKSSPHIVARVVDRRDDDRRGKVYEYVRTNTRTGTRGRFTQPVSAFVAEWEPEP